MRYMDPTNAAVSLLSCPSRERFANCLDGFLPKSLHHPEEKKHQKRRYSPVCQGDFLDATMYPPNERPQEERDTTHGKCVRVARPSSL